jgi:hypothetical protein
MKEMRIKMGLNLKKLDLAGKETKECYKLDENPQGFILDSSIRFGILVLKKFVREWRERREIDIKDAQDTFARGERLNGSQ